MGRQTLWNPVIVLVRPAYSRTTEATGAKCFLAAGVFTASVGGLFLIAFAARGFG